MREITRRGFGRTLAGTAAAAATASALAPFTFSPRAARAAASAHVVVVGGGFGGATAAKALKRAVPEMRVTLVEQNAQFVTCPYSNLVLGGWRELDSITHSYDALRERWGIEVVQARAAGIDGEARTVTLEGGESLSFDRAIVSPGIDLRLPGEGGIEGYDEAAWEAMPHAWKAGPQTSLLRAQLEAMEDGGTFVIAAPPNPFRCPPGPYERISLIAHYLSTQKPNSRILLLDSKDSFSKQGLFTAAWERFYPGMIEIRLLPDDGKVVRVDPAAMELETEFGEIHRADVANVVPPQWAGRIARESGLAAESGWCPVEPTTFESSLVPGVHVVGDASIAAPMPKSGFSAHNQGKAAAAACVALLAGEAPANPAWANTCYSHVAPGYAISVAAVYRVEEGAMTAVEGAGGLSGADWDDGQRQLEAAYADGWYRSITEDMFG